MRKSADIQWRSLPPQMENRLVGGARRIPVERIRRGDLHRLVNPQLRMRQKAGNEPIFSLGGKRRLAVNPLDEITDLRLLFCVGRTFFHHAPCLPRSMACPGPTRILSRLRPTQHPTIAALI